MEDCIFCKIVSGEVPSEKIAETENLYAFLDLRPINPGHALIIPKEHYEDLLDMPNELGEDIIALGKKIGGAILEATDAKGFNFYQNNGSAAGQAVFHVHFHVIPRMGGERKIMWEHSESTDEERKEMRKRLTSAL